MRRPFRVLLGLTAASTAASISMAQTQYEMAPTLGTYGTTGLIDMPTAQSQPDGELNSTVSYFRGAMRATLTFQITPRLSGSFRYSHIPQFQIPNNDDLYDRSFDLRYRVLDESKWLPSIAVGVQDFIGTGVYQGEYLVATKHLHPKLKATLGVGWGRLGGTKGAAGRTLDGGNGGTPNAGSLFSGPIAPFGGIEWQTPIKGLNLKAEYSSDVYLPETTRALKLQRKSGLNFGIDYALKPGTHLSVNYLHGTDLGVQLSFAFNPKRPAFPSGSEGAPLPVITRPALTAGQTAYNTDWAQGPDARTAMINKIREPLKAQLAASGLRLEAITLEPTKVKLYIRNTSYNSGPQAFGRAARALTHTVPASVETFVIIPVENGVPLTSVTMTRSDIEALEHDGDGAAKLAARTDIAPIRRVDRDAVYNKGLYPAFEWSLKPYLRSSLFDPDSPIRAEVGLRLQGQYDIAPGLSVSGSIIKPLAGNLDNITRPSNSVIRHVRSDHAKYYREGNPALERLTADYMFKLSPEVYGRITAGYLETMYGGVSAEVLWKPTGRNFALGAEVNYVKQRDFNQRLGFQNYSVLTGHVSAYADLWGDFKGQLDIGRYLAGDVGGTASLNRTFNNGWKVGAFVTLTNIPFSQFGEGSFDKGITFSVPLSTIVGNATRQTPDLVMRPLYRDGGARVNVEKRLYGILENYDRPSIKSGFGRVWR